MEYDLQRPWLTLDDWQKDYIESEQDCFLLCGRQVGKSAAMSIKAAERAIKRENSDILVIAFTEKQAYQLFFRTLMYLTEMYPYKIKTGKEKPTKHEIHLKNGSIIRCYATGLTGEGLRGFTITDLFVDEASRLSDEVFTAITPMLSVTSGTIDMASTPAGAIGYFYECSDDPANKDPKKDLFKHFYVSAETCPRTDKRRMENDKISMSKMEYAQEYLAIFTSNLRRVFDDDILKACAVLTRQEIGRERKYYLGVDIARMGEDESTFEIIEKVGKDILEQRESIVTIKTLTTETENKIIELDKLWDFRKIGIDAGSGSLGVGIFDHLLINDQTKRKVIAMNNNKRIYDRDGTTKGKIFKEDEYTNLQSLMQQGKIKLLKDDDLLESLKSVQFEYIIKEGEPSRLHIFGNYTHIAEGLIRAAWLASKDKSLNPIIL